MPTLAKVRANDVRHGRSREAVGRPVIRKVRFSLDGKLYVLIVLLVLVLLTAAVPLPAQAGQLHHYEYVFPNNSVYVYDIDHRGALVKHVTVPTSAGVRGVVASAVTGMLYISYGSQSSAGFMLKYNLMTDGVVWAKRYPFGVDSISVSPDLFFGV
jgi:hypothetical protein